MDRPNWETYFLELAKVVATRSTCPRAAVGAVIVKNHRVLTTGYNGAPPGEPHCTEVGCLVENEHCQRTIHAETNAIAQAARFGIVVEGAVLYCWSIRHSTGKPVESCTKCSQVMKAAGIARIVGRIDL